MQRVLSGDGCIVLLLRLSCKNAQDGEIVLHLLKSCKGCLTVIRNVAIIGGNGGLFGCAPPASIKESFRKARTDRPEAAGPVEPVECRGSLESCHGT